MITVVEVTIITMALFFPIEIIVIVNGVELMLFQMNGKSVTFSDFKRDHRAYFQILQVDNLVTFKLTPISS